MLTMIAGAALAFSFAAAPDTTELKADSLLQVLKEGGYTIILRHARTDRSVVDDPRYVALDDRSKQRNLSEAGVADAKAIGFVMRAAGIRFSEIVSSPLFRTLETAQMAFGEPTTSLLLRSMNKSPEQRALIVKAPAPGTNRALVTHHFIIELYVPGIKLGEIGESEAAVVRTTPNGEIEMVGRFTLADWERLSGGKVGAVNAAEQQAARNQFQRLHNAVQVSPPPGAPASSDLKPFDWTETPSTRLAGYYLHAFNSGDAGEMRTFIDKYLVVDPNRSTDQRVETYRGMFNDHGSLQIVGTEKADHHEAIIRFRSKRGEMNLIVILSANDHTRAESIRMTGGAHR
jgi:phosphohistidine phosphatase SixA